MSFKAYGQFVQVEPVIPDSGLVKLMDGTEDNRSVFKVVSVGSKVEGIAEGQYVFAVRTAEFNDKQTGVKVRLCHANEIVAVAPDGEEISAVPQITIGTPSLN